MVFASDFRDGIPKDYKLKKHELELEISTHAKFLKCAVKPALDLLVV